MNDLQTGLAIIDIITLVSLFSTGSALIYLALSHGWIPAFPNINWQSGVSRFAFSVGTGVCTWLLTEGLFGYGVEDASVTGIATAAVIGGVSKFTGIGSA